MRRVATRDDLPPGAAYVTHPGSCVLHLLSDDDSQAECGRSTSRSEVVYARDLPPGGSYIHCYWCDRAIGAAP